MKSATNSTVTNSLDRALALLEMVEQKPGGLTAGQIRRELGIPKSSYSYLINRLQRKGYITRDEETHRYKIGLTPLVLAYGTLREMGFRSVTEPSLYRLASETRLAASLGILERGRVLLIDRVESPDFVRDAVNLSTQMENMRAGRLRRRQERDLGREFPAHTNATGKVLLAYLPPSQAAKIIEQEGLTRVTPLTIVSKIKLLEEIAIAREVGYAGSNEEQYMGVRGIAAPIFDVTGNACAAVSATGSPKDPIWKDTEKIVDMVKAAARDMSRGLRVRQS